MRLLALSLSAVVACGPGSAPDETGPGEAPVPVETARADDAVRTDARAETGSVEASGIGPDGATSVLGRYDLRKPVRRFDLPGRLDEISGLALTEDGRLLAHDDERARVHVIDRLTGEVGKSFDLGSGEVRDDFEGIARIGERLFLASSRGFLYEFREGADDADVAYRVTNTRLGRDCEVEGLDYDAGTDALVFACKESTQGRDFLVLHRLPVAPDAERPPPLLVPRERLESVGLDPAFRPSAVLVTSEDTFLLLSATTESILEVDREGNIVSGSRLDVGAHAQPEGLAMDSDGLLYIADEENDNDARITVYAPAGNAP